MKTLKLAGAFGAVVVLAGCVSQARYDQAISHTQLTSAELAQRSEQVARLRAEIAFERDARVSQRARHRQYARELERYADRLETEREIADDRAEQYRDLWLRLGAQIDLGDLDVVVRDGRVVVRLPYDVLFASGRTELEPKGEIALAAVASVLKAMPNREFQVAGHTDDVPIANERFKSNWELSMARALRVLRFLSSKGVPTTSLSAAAYADVDPVAPNQHAEGRRLNRRIEVTLQPRIEPMEDGP